MKRFSLLIALAIVTIIACDPSEKDNTAPTITLEGYNPSYVSLDSAYIEPGFSAIDDVDGDVSINAEVTGDVNTSLEGTYNKYYNVKDAAGNEAEQVIREVKVVVF